MKCSAAECLQSEIFFFVDVALFILVMFVLEKWYQLHFLFFFFMIN